MSERERERGPVYVCVCVCVTVYEGSKASEGSKIVIDDMRLKEDSKQRGKWQQISISSSDQSQKYPPNIVTLFTDQQYSDTQTHQNTLVFARGNSLH